ncbi:TadE/TadG family type IV pilus assembly protein [Magnetospirillum sp. UT-4]|uniref:TadE/TadG family type IV pilus assembly protein n=1 Tax=Magnetospirillum sp. UT-4 TaxID=2681467 RepID=UPI001574603C|nr:TadE/TadG family type IV pilus assembly protein [Magnetospirillum sp. UT-4]
MEYALLLPAMVSALLGAVETFQAVQAYSKAVSAAQTVADLSARADSHSGATLAAIATAAQRVMDPLPSTTASMGIRVESVVFAANGTATAQWGYSWGSGADPVPLSKVTGLGKAGESVVTVSFRYAHAPLLHDLLGTLTFRETAVARPRVTRVIPFSG